MFICMHVLCTLIWKNVLKLISGKKFGMQVKLTEHDAVYRREKYLLKSQKVNYLIKQSPIFRPNILDNTTQ